MPKIRIAVFLGVILLIIGFFFFVQKTQAPGNNAQLTTDNQQQTERTLQTITNNEQQGITKTQNGAADNQQTQMVQTVDPLDGARGRITKKPFGMYITPSSSPVQPEKFQGFHTGVDLETTSEEQDVDVQVLALCDGKLLEARYASGYGGVAVESCTLNNEAVTVVYGHLRLSSVAPKVGDQLKMGNFLANLGTGYSSETDGERKHLHLGVHKGKSVNILGYVQAKMELSGWLDPAQFLP